MEPSILYSVKRFLGVSLDATPFDEEIIIGINSALMVLNQLGIGPKEGLVVTGITETWSDLLDDFKDLEAVKSYVALKTRLVFDPPANSFVVNALEKQVSEYEWRLAIRQEEHEMEKPATSRRPRRVAHGTIKHSHA